VIEKQNDQVKHYVSSYSVLPLFWSFFYVSKIKLRHLPSSRKIYKYSFKSFIILTLHFAMSMLGERERNVILLDQDL